MGSPLGSLNSFVDDSSTEVYSHQYRSECGRLATLWSLKLCLKVLPLSCQVDFPVELRPVHGSCALANPATILRERSARARKCASIAARGDLQLRRIS